MNTFQNSKVKRVELELVSPLGYLLNTHLAVHHSLEVTRGCKQRSLGQELNILKLKGQKETENLYLAQKSFSTSNTHAYILSKAS